MAESHAACAAMDGGYNHWAVFLHAFLHDQRDLRPRNYFMYNHLAGLLLAFIEEVHGG
jgi:hypothetical protein